MKAPRAPAAAEGSASLASPAIIVVLVLLLGATIYLWRGRYIRRRTAYVVMAAIVIALGCLAAWMYMHPMAAV